jgi:hypothetical protein
MAVSRETVNRGGGEGVTELNHEDQAAELRDDDGFRISLKEPPRV